MRVFVLSDIHVETMPKNIVRNPYLINFTNDFDIVVVAGDTHPGVQGLMWLRQLWKDKIIITIAGNHEFYSRDFHKHYGKLKEKAKELDIHFLQNESIVINDVKFIGATLWTNFKLFGNQSLSMIVAKQAMNDYNKIKVAMQHKLSPEIVLNQHNMSVDFINNELQSSGKKFVITHHAPCSKSINVRYINDSTSPCYASDLDYIFTDDTTIWLHGHIHSSADYMFHNTRILCNPYGYFDDKNKDFNPNLIVEI